jgi:hypothetical protein
VIDIPLADYLKQFESVNNYPVLVSFYHGILDREEIEALDKTKTLVHFYMNSGSALSLFGNNTQNGLAIISVPLRLRNN